MTFFVDVPLRWGDMDAYGHVNNVTYLQYLEEARVGAFEAWFPTDLITAGVVVARAEIEYLRPLLHRSEPVRIDVWVSAAKGASFDLDYVVRDPEQIGTTVYARATTTLVLFDLASGSPRKIDDDLRALLAAQTREPVALRSRA